MKTYDTWEPWQIAYLINNAATKSNAQIGAVIGKDRKNVYSRRKSLGLPKCNSKAKAAADPLALDNARARAAGLSYGMFKARQYEAMNRKVLR